MRQQRHGAQQRQQSTTMADRLTQLQDCYDQVRSTLHLLSFKKVTRTQQLATQFYASIRYLSLHHTSSALTVPSPANSQHHHNHSNSTSNPNHDQQPTSQQEQAESSSYPPDQRPDTPTTFSSAQRELAQDLLLKVKQIEYLISVLPGVEHSQDKQEARIIELDAELRKAFEARQEAEQERELWLGKVDGIIGGIKR